MRTEVNVFLKENELGNLPKVVRMYSLLNYILTDTVILPRSAEYMYTFEERREVKS